MKLYGSIEIQICKVESGNLKYCCTTENIMENLILVEKSNIAGLFFGKSNVLHITFQKEIEGDLDHFQIVEQVKRTLGQILFFDYALDNSNLKYWLKA